VLADNVVAALKGIRTRTSPEDCAAFVSDESGMPGGLPLAVVSPATVTDVQRVMRTATDLRLAVTPRGAGTGLSGGALATTNGLVLDLSGLTRIEALDPHARTSDAQAGVVNAAVSAAAKPYGLMYAPDPSSWESSTIGGNIATNAGGLRCARYGATRASVLGLQVVLADGRLLHTGGRTLKRSAGYDLTQLFIGSEGTLGVVVGATLKLLPLSPPQVTALACFGDVRSAAVAAEALVATTTPTLLELMEGLVVTALDRARGTGFGSDTGAVLIVQLDDAPGVRDLLSAAMTRGGTVDLAVTDDPQEATELLDIRRAAFGALQALGPLLVEDVCVPPSRLAEMVSAVVDIAADLGVQACTVAHAADGNLHPVLLLGDDPRAERRAADAIFHRAQRLGGTVSGEHGIGRLKREWLAQELTPVALDVQQSLKATLDPLGLLNPGAVFPGGAV
jgi:glycolate oxidase